MPQLFAYDNILLKAKPRGVAQPGSAPEWGHSKTVQSLSKSRLIIANFIASRRQGLSPRTIEYYEDRLTRAIAIIGTHMCHKT